jgi:nucleotide-binding universal stress UspA family protein
MYENILLLLDCSPCDRVIVEHIKKLANIHHSHIHLFHIVHAHTLDQKRVLTGDTEKCLKKAAASLRQGNIEVSYSYEEGEPGPGVIDKIDETKWDLIALATHGHRFFTDVIFGSISDAIKHHTNIPILLIRYSEKEQHRR